MMIVPGTAIGNYRVLSLLGEGGMGVVYHGEHVVLGRQVAIKVLLQHVARQGVLVQRFINEGRIASQMNHRNVVDVLDCGMFPSPEVPDAQWYIAMEFLHGKSLGRFIADYGGKPIDIATIVHIIGEAANGLHAAHERHQLVHRDIKPDNLYVTPAEDDPLRIKILDFGIAKLRQEMSGVKTQSHTAMGTPAYSAPEQLRESKDVDARADVWALGVVTHEMLTGVRPWGPTNSVWEIIAQHSALKIAPDPRAFRPDIPPKIAAAVAKAMEPDPNRRWKSVKAYACALAEAATMPYSVNGMAILDKFASELTRASNLSVTIGRPMPREIQVQPPEIVTARERRVAATPPMVMSDNGQFSGAAEWPADAALARPISTFAASSGESIARASVSSRGRVWMLAIGGLGLVALGFVAVTLLAHRSNASGPVEPARAAVVIDASESRAAIANDASAPAPDASARTSALAIITTPDGAEVFLDGASRGRAPLNIELPVGKKIELRAESSGYAPASRSVTIDPTATTVRIELTRLIDAGAPVNTVAPPATKLPATHIDRPREHKRDGAGARLGGGSGSDQSFSPNDVL